MSDATVMLKAILAGESYTSTGLEDTTEHRDLWHKIAQSIEDLPPGVVPDIPAEYADWED